MTTVWMAVSFSSAGSGDGATVFGVFSTKELAVDELKRQYSDEKNICYEETVVTFGRILKEGNIIKEWGYAQALSIEVDKKMRLEL